MFKRRKRLALTLVAGLVLMLSGSGSEGVLAGSPPASPVPHGNRANCPFAMAVAVPLDSGQKQEPLQCFNTREEVRAALAQRNQRAEANRQAETNQTDGASVVAYEFELGDFYRDAYRGNGTLTFIGSTCNASFEVWEYGWDDMISSMDIYCGGGASLYQNAYSNGIDCDVVACRARWYGAGYTDYVGGYMNDLTSSVHFWAGGIYP